METTCNPTNLGKVSVEFDKFDLRYLNSYGIPFVAHTGNKAGASCGYGNDKAFLSKSNIEDMLDALVFYLLIFVFNYAKQFQQVHKAPILYIIFT